MICATVDGKYNSTQITTGDWGLTFRINKFTLQHAGSLAAVPFLIRARRPKLEARDIPTLVWLLIFPPPILGLKT